jgi:hypothetical protein
MSVRRRRTISVGVLLAGYSALLAGLFGLTAKPLIGVLMVLGGMALSICSAAELVQYPPETTPPPRKPAGLGDCTTSAPARRYSGLSNAM